MCLGAGLKTLTIVVLLLLLMSLETGLGLSPPLLVDLPVTGSPTRIDSDGKGILAIAYRDRRALGLYYVDVGSYIEVDLEHPALMTVFTQNNAVVLLVTRDRLAFIDLVTRKTSYLTLEGTASSIAGGDQLVYIVYPRMQRVEKLDVTKMQVIENIDYRAADGLEHASAHGRNLYLVSHSLDELLVVGERISTVKLGGVASFVKAVGDGAWVILTDDTVLKISGTSIVYKTNLPRATFVSSAAVLETKLVYASQSRRVLGIVDTSGFRESRVADSSPISVAVSSGRRIWYLDGLQLKIWSLYDSVAPRLSDWRVETQPDGSAVVRVRASDPDRDLKSVFLVPVLHQGIYVIRGEPIEMITKQEYFETIYRPGPDITRVEFYVNATDFAGNSVSEKVGEIDYTKQTTPQITTITNTVPTSPAAIPALLSELLLLIPLILVISALVFSRRPRRRKPSKRR